MSHKDQGLIAMTFVAVMEWIAIIYLLNRGGG